MGYMENMCSSSHVLRHNTRLDLALPACLFISSHFLYRSIFIWKISTAIAMGQVWKTYTVLKHLFEPGVVAHTFYPSTGRQKQADLQIWGQPGLFSKSSRSARDP